MVHGSDPELARVVRNLLSNAIRHTPPDGTVVVAAGARDGQAWMRVDVPYRGNTARTPALAEESGASGLPAESREPALTEESESVIEAE